MSDRPGIELNTVQLVASMAAAVTGAILTSYIGDGGTILGTAVGSGASTAGFAVYKHYLVRTKDKVAPVIVEHARQWTPTGAVATGQNPTRADVNPTRADVAAGYQNGNSRNGNGQPATTAADWERARRTAPGWAEPTRAEPGSGLDATRHDLPVTRQDPAPTRQDAAPTRAARYDQTARYGTVQLADGGGSGSGGAGGDGPGRHGRPSGPAGWLSGRPRWVLTAGSAAAVFIVVMVVITVIELGTGKPIDASVWGRHQTGTTLGGSHGSTATPSPTGSVTPTQSGTSPGVQQKQSTAPSSGASTGAPTPSSVPTVEPTPTIKGPASGAASAPAQ